MQHVLAVDDDPEVLEAYRAALEREDRRVDTALDAIEASRLLAVRDYDVIISDIAMPGMDGIEFLQAVRQADPDVPVILSTGNPSLETALRAIEYGAFLYLLKPVTLATLEASVDRAVQSHALASLRRQALALAGVEALAPSDRARLEGRFEEALGSLWMAFQPIVSSTGRATVAYEALLRCDEPTLADPLRFLAAAEQLGRLPTLGRAIRRAVAAAAASAPDGALLFVNLHPSDLDDDELCEPDAPLSAIAGRVVLEITERASLDRVNDLPGRIAALRRLGYRIAVDDLGAGYANLGVLATLEPELVKLDASLVRGIAASGAKQAVLRSMVSLCAEMSMGVIAEGVETPAERDALAALGCDLLQGFLFARPARTFHTPAWAQEPA